MHKFRADSGEVKQAVESKIRRGNGEASEFITAKQPVNHIIDIVQAIAAECEIDVIRLDGYWDVEGRFGNVWIRTGDVSRAGHRLFQHEAAGI